MTLPNKPTSKERAANIARGLFLRDDNYYGCAESTFVALQKSLDLSDPDDSSVAMVLNGGVAYGGGICGAISGAAMAIGKLAGDRVPDHQQAKRTARRIIQLLVTDFEAEFGGKNCSDLIEFDISTAAGHDSFVASDVWRTTCMEQIEFSVSCLAALADPDEWTKTVHSLDGDQ